MMRAQLKTWWRVIALVAVVAGLPRASWGASCPPGQFSATGQDPCMTCPAGTFADLAGQTACTPCPLGRFNAM